MMPRKLTQPTDLPRAAPFHRARPVLMALLASTVALGLACRSADAQTLEEALSQAYQSNPALDAQRARLRATDERVPQALSGWRPTLSATLEQGISQVESNAASLNRETNSFIKPRQMGATIQQPVYEGGQTVAATRSAENTVRSERFRLDSVEQRTLIDATTNYANVYRDQAVLELNIRNEQRLARQLEATRDRFKVGEVTKTDVFQSEARLARATADRIRAEGTLDVSRAAYRSVIGTAPGILQRPPLPNGLPQNLGQAIDVAISSNPDVGTAQFTERSARDDVDRATGALLPTVGLVGRAFADREQSRPGGRTDQYEALVRMTVPIYSAGDTYSRVRQAKQIVSQQRRNLDQAQRDAEQSASSSWHELEAARARIGSLRKQVEANRVALEGVEREAEVGSRTVLDVLDAEQELLDSQVQLVTAERDEVVAAYRLKSAVGDMTAQRLGLPVQFYDPTIHYNEVRDSWIGLSSSGGNGQSSFAPVDTTNPAR